jgi:xylan 1,4-beta-xylosidase
MKTLLGRIFCLAAVLIIAATVPAETTQVVVIDSSAPTHPFPHFWEQMFGSGRAVLSLRDSYRRDLREVKQVTDFRYVRFHAVFHDEMGIYDEDAQGHPT